MSSTLIFVHYNGEWDVTNNYVDFDVVGIALDRDCKYDSVKLLIAHRINVNGSSNNLVLKYKIRDSYPPIDVDDDASLEFYKELKSRELDYTKFPLCVVLRENGGNVIDRCFGGTLSLNEEGLRVTQLQPDKVQRLREVMGIDKRPTRTDFFDFAIEAANSISEEVVSIRSKLQQKTAEENVVIHDGSEYCDLKIGKLFNTSDLLKRTLKFFALTEKFNLRVVKSSPEEYHVACLNVKCGWFLRSSCVGNSRVFMVRKMNNRHTCPLDERMNEQRQATADIVSECIKRKFCNLKTTYTPADIIRDMKDDFQVDLNYKQAWRSRRKAIDDVRGKPDESYQLVTSYLELVKDANQGSFVNVHATGDQKFEYLFMSLSASIKGWHHCRPIVVVDGTFLKASYGGTLLTASVQDANAHILPLAFAIVDSENDASYEWFFENLKQAIGTRSDMCIVSDRNASLVKAVTKVYPSVAQCYCMYHLGNNIKKHFKRNATVVRKKFITAATAYTIADFDKTMDELRSIDNRVVEYLESVGFDQWSRVHCPHNRFLSMTSNAAESINAALCSARELPVTTLLECLRALQQKWNVANGDEARCTFTPLAKMGHDMLEENYKLSFKMTVHKASDRIFQVSIGKSIFVVDMAKNTCTCNRFQMDELPCAHALSVLRGRNEDPISYCSRYYYKETMVATYDDIVYPVGCEGGWTTNSVDNDDVVQPPAGRVRAGRPKMKRNRSIGEYPKRKTKCSRCGETGHNIKTCKNPPLAR